MDKRNIGQFLSIKFEFTSGTVIYTGYVIDYSEDWTLLKHCLFDYLVDGYILLNNKYITEFKRGNEERFKEKVLDLKGQRPKPKERIDLQDTGTILKYLSDKYGIFQFNQRTNETCWLGKVKKIKGTELKIDYLNPKGIWSSSMPTYRLGNIRTIEFDTDYINSLKLVAKKRR
jgi:hypothetical protein